MSDPKRLSYTSAGVFPMKVLQSKDAVDDEGRISPVHLQLNPTNACNLSCSFCSCSARDKTKRMEIGEIMTLLGEFAGMGTRAVTITGGGEPLMHPRLNDIVEVADTLGMKTGLVSNGLLLDKLISESLTWVRVSFSDSRELSKEFVEAVTCTRKRLPSTDFAFSYVLTRHPNYDKLRSIIRIAADFGFTHVRIVSDLLDVANTPTESEVLAEVSGIYGQELVLHQKRQDFCRGVHLCLISLLKPVVSAEGYIYPCCGVQYAKLDPSLDYSDDMKMCHWTEFVQHYEAQTYFDGSKCDRCYYDEYNTLLALATEALEHKEFV